MIVQDPMVQGGIAAVTSGYYGSRLERLCDVTYVQSYCDGSKGDKLRKALAAYKEFRQLLRTESFDVVHIHSSFGPSFYRKIPFIHWAAARGIPIVNHIHGAEFGPFYAEASGLKKALVRKVYGKCTRFVVLSEEWKERIAQIVPSDRITVVPNYSNPVAGSVAKELWYLRNRRQVLFLGEIGLRKGAYDIPAIVRAVRSVLPEITFVLGGSGDIEGVQERLDPADVSSVSFPGWVRDAEKDRLLRQSSLFLLPSYNEGQPMSILDAMGYALPIVSTNVGGIPQLVSSANGVLCEPGDAQAMAEAIMQVLRGDPEEMGMQSLAVVNARYSLDAHIEALVNIYNQVIR